MSFGQDRPPKLAEIAKVPPRAMLLATPVGPKSKSDLLHLSFSLQSSDPAGMQRLADSVSIPASPEYRHYLLPEQVGARFGASPLVINKLVQQLESNGIRIKSIGKNRLSILADCTVSQAEKFFDVEMATFKVKPLDSTDTGSRFSFTTTPKVPAEFASVISNIGGLENFSRPKRRSLSAAQIRGAYELDAMTGAGKTGQGRTVGISSWDGFRISALSQLYQAANLPVPSGGIGSNVQIVPIDGGDGFQEYQFGEGDLDIQCVLGIAPLCNLIVYDNDTNQGAADPVAVLAKELDDNLADVITESYGWLLDVPTTQAAHLLHLSMTLQGITYVAASGDTGTDWQGYNYPQIDPEVLTIGGTTLHVDATKHRSTEVGWNSNGYSGGGGWVVSNDVCNIRASYQSSSQFLAGLGVPSVTAVPYRLVPDLSLNADPDTGYVVYTSNGTSVIGGTSGSSPTFAGGLAIAMQQLIGDGFLLAGSNGKSRFGRIQDLLYGYNGDPSVFYDITTGTNGQLPNGSTSTAVSGWDTDTGWGAMSFSGFVAKIEGSSTISSLQLSANSVFGGNQVTGTVTLSNPAPENGITVTVTATGSYAQVPNTISIAGGAKTATFTIQTIGVANIQIVNLSVSNRLGSQGSTLTILPATLSAVSFTPESVIGGNSVTAIVQLSGKAPPSGAVVKLKSSRSNFSVPAQIVVPAGTSGSSVSIPTKSVTAKLSADISATYQGATVQTQVTVLPVSVSQLALSQSTVVGGSAVAITGTVTLNGPAPAGGLTVKLRSADPKFVNTPSTVAVAAGKLTAAITLSHYSVSQDHAVVLTASTGDVQVQAPLTVTPFQVLSVAFAASSVIGGTPNSGTVTLNAAPGSNGKSQTIHLAVDSRAAQCPLTVIIAVGKTSGAFQVQTLPVSQDSVVNCSASLGSSTTLGSFSVLAPTLATLTLSPATVKGSGTVAVTGTVTLTGKAPVGGLMLVIASSSSTASVPASVTVASGKSVVTFKVTHSKVAITTTVAISATLNGTIKSGTLTLTP